MKIRKIKQRVVQSSIHNVSFFVRLDLKVKREITEDDLVVGIPVYDSSTENSIQYDMFLTGIWFPMIEQYPELLDSCGYDESKPLTETTMSFDIQMNGGNDKGVYDRVNKLIAELNEKCPNLFEVEEIALYGYNSFTGETFVVESGVKNV